MILLTEFSLISNLRVTQRLVCFENISTALSRTQEPLFANWWLIILLQLTSALSSYPIFVDTLKLYITVQLGVWSDKKVKNISDIHLFLNVWRWWNHLKKMRRYNFLLSKLATLSLLSSNELIHTNMLTAASPERSKSTLPAKNSQKHF